MNESYRPTYLYLPDENFEQLVKDIYFDTLIVKKDGLVWTYAAWGDGAHVNQVAVAGLKDNTLKSDDNAWHIDQLREFISMADAVIAIRDHKVVYKRNS